MPAPFPRRDRAVYFVGAGVSSALGLPNTPSLIQDVIDFARQKAWLTSDRLPERLERAFRFFYPDARHRGFRPDVVDFFSALRTYLDVGAGLPGTGLRDAPELFRSLKSAIAHLLIERIRTMDGRLAADGHPYLERMVQPGNVIITSNWDFLLERYAYLKGIPLRLSAYGEREVTLLKLHGSIDWCQVQHRTPGRSDGDYSSLREQMVVRIRRFPPGGKSEDLARIHALEHWSDSWRRVKSRAAELHMVTMVRGKAGDLGPLRGVWRDAYTMLSRARELEIVGYSMPPDDVEIRTLLRAGIGRGDRRPKITVRNPSPGVHVRVRSYLSEAARSDYHPVNALP